MTTDDSFKERSTRFNQSHSRCLFVVLGWCYLAASAAWGQSSPGTLFLDNGVTAHRGNSFDYPENTMPAFKDAIEAGADWIEADVFLTGDGQLVVIHDATTGRVGDKNLSVTSSTYQELLSVDVATNFRKRHQQTLEECPADRVVLLEDLIREVQKQEQTRLSLQPKMDCVPQMIQLVKQLQAQPWIGFNDGNLALMAQVKELAPQVPVFWDRPAATDVEEDIRVAKQYGFESLVLNHAGVTADKVKTILQAGLEVGAWTVNDVAQMSELLDLGVQRLYTDDPVGLLAIHRDRSLVGIACEGRYPHHLQGVAVDEDCIYWSFTTQLIKTTREGQFIKKVDVANHHGDLCLSAGKIYVAVNLGEFNHPDGNADSWVYVYDSETLREEARHEIQEAFHGAGGIGYHEGHFYVIGGLPPGVDENYVYEYDQDFKFVKRNVIRSGPTLMGIQTAAFAHGRWWFGCYGNPKILLVTDQNFEIQGRYEFDCSLGVAGLHGERLLIAAGNCQGNQGCDGTVTVAKPDAKTGLKRVDVSGR